MDNIKLAALVIMLCVSVTGWSMAGAQTWSEFGVEKAKPPIDKDRIAEPVFAFLVNLAEGDSLGVWSGQDVSRYAAAAGESSRFPLQDLVSIRRTRPSPEEIARRPGVKVMAHWDLDLTADLDRPMPYDILGYHPGSLLVSRHLELVELFLGSKKLSASDGKLSYIVSIQDIRVFALTAGHMVLDADGLIDALLGSALDDSWTVGLVLAKENGHNLGLGVSLGRGGRKIYGEFDFAQDKVQAHGRPEMSALSGYCRRWLNPEKGLVPPPWKGLDNH